MKRVLSIVFLFLFLLNVMGYYGVFMGLQLGHERQARIKLDLGDYSPGREVVIKVPLTVPYSTDQKEFVRVDGEFEHLGEYYRLVKQKLFKDTLFIVCVKDDNLKEMHQALTDYVKTFANAPVSSAKSSSNNETSFSFIKDYTSGTIALTMQETGWAETLRFNCDETLSVVSFSSSINHPPEA